jgi:hypothetical protein
MLRSLRQELEEQDVPQDVQHLLQQVQLRAAGDRAGHAQPLPRPCYATMVNPKTGKLKCP